MILVSHQCSTNTKSWDEADSYCKKIGGVMLMEPTRSCSKEYGGSGEWIGLRKRWMFNTVSQNTKG